MVTRPLARMLLSLVILVVVSAPAWSGESPVRGGTLRFAMIDTPPSLDAHILTATLSTTVSQHFLETLFTFTENYDPVPHLAKSADVRDGGKLILIQLRQGVLFHNGKEMTSDDVVASLNRWGRLPGAAPWLWRVVGKARLTRDEPHGAEQAFREAGALWPHEEAELGLGLALAAQGRRSEALISLGRVCRVNPALARQLADPDLRRAVEDLNRARRKAHAN